MNKNIACSGSFCFVLHSHLPFVKKAGVWPFGEEWLLEGMLETYIPLLDILYELKEQKIPYRIVIGITPVLAEQLADEYFLKRFEEFMSAKIQRASFDIDKFSARHQPEYRQLSEFYKNNFVKILDNFHNKYNRNIITAFKKLQDDGNIEIITSAATHGYLPLLSRNSSVYAQLKIGIDTYRKHFGRKPKGIWLPECAYRGGQIVHITKNESYYRPSIDELLASLGIEYFIVDSHAIEGGEAYWGGKRSGIYGEIKAPAVDYTKKTGRNTAIPYLTKSGVVAFGRNRETGLLVWSGEYGYPGDGNYREFHKKDYDSGLQYWKITSTKIDLGLKEIYQYQNTVCRINENADHFNTVVERILADYNKSTNEFGMVISPYDTELFGHWWFEGIEWLKQVLIKTSKNPTISLMTPSEYLQKYPPKLVAELPESSWGDGGGHYVWFNDETKWMWPYIHDAEVQMEDIVQKFIHGDVSTNTTRALNQSARELLLLQSSDWPFLITTKQAKEYAAERFLQHYNRFCRLVSGLKEGGGMGGRTESAEFLGFLTEIEEIDSVFTEIDYRKFARREPPARRR
ncbi:MAG: 1,4-alpha-glucan branching protein domain-containing protein [Elusimicrobiota bacterium]